MRQPLTQPDLIGLDKNPHDQQIMIHDEPKRRKFSEGAPTGSQSLRGLGEGLAANKLINHKSSVIRQTLSKQGRGTASLSP